jgi:biopolymer transport protein ExbD
MPRSKVIHLKTPAGDVSFNMVPMVDVVFLLILFFILTGEIASRSLARVNLPKPLQSQALPVEAVQVKRIIVNVLAATEVPAGSTVAMDYQIDGVSYRPGDVAALSQAIKSRRNAAGGAEFYVEIRADRNVRYGDVEPILRAAADAKVRKVNIAAYVEENR